MSKLAVVRRSLETNPEVMIARINETNSLPDRDGYWSHTIDFWVAPKRGLFSARELQEFMMSLVPAGLTPSAIDNFRQYDGRSNLQFGKLYFDKDIGEQRVTKICTLTDEELFNVHGFVNGQRTIEASTPYRRRTWIKPFPCDALVKDLIEGRLNSEYEVEAEDLKRYH